MKNNESVNNTVRISTGINFLDETTQGGFLPGKAYVVSGTPGTGKSIFGLQFLMASLAENKNSVYVCVNEKPDDLIATAKSLGWCIEPAISDNKVQFLDMSPFFSRYAVKSDSKNELRRDEIHIRKVLVELAKYTRANSAECLVIDSINSILPEHRKAHATAFTRELVFSIEEHLGCTSLLTFDQWEVDGYNKVHPIESYAAGVFHLGLAKKADQYDRTIMIKKMRATAVEPAIYRFAIKPVEGISPTQSAAKTHATADNDYGNENEATLDRKKGTNQQEDMFVRR